MGASSATNAFAFAPNFQKGILAAGRIIVLLKRQTKIADPYQPAVQDFVRELYHLYFHFLLYLQVTLHLVYRQQPEKPACNR